MLRFGAPGSLAGRFTILDFYSTALGREVGHTSELKADHGTLLIGPFSSTENAPAVPQMHYLLKVRLSALSRSSIPLPQSYLRDVTGCQTKNKTAVIVTLT